MLWRSIFMFLVASALCVAQDLTGAKVLFGDPTSNVNVRPGSTATKSPARPPNVKANPSSPSTAPAPAPIAPVSAPADEVAGLRYWVELESQGKITRVNTNRTFHSSERIRFHVESNIDGSLVILQSQDGGPYEKLFPNGVNMSGKIEKYKDQVLPSKDGWFRFDNKPGDISLMIMIESASTSARPSGSATGSSSATRTTPAPTTQTVPAPTPTKQTAPTQTAQNQPASTGSPAPTKGPAPATQTKGQAPRASQQSPEVVAAAQSDLERRIREQAERLKGSKALIVEEDSDSPEPASYAVVDTRRAPDVEKGLVAVEIKLTHR